MQMTLALRSAADKALVGDEGRRAKYLFSVTEEEIHRGILNISKEDRMKNTLWFKRNIVDLDTHIKKKDARVGAFTGGGLEKERGRGRGRKRGRGRGRGRKRGRGRGREI